MRVPKAINNLIERFERLPGIGPKSAARLTYYLLHVPELEIEKFASALTHLKSDTIECEICHNVGEATPCEVCSDERRDKNVICVVENPLDVLAFERGGSYQGVYHVLHGVIDPLHNIGPDEIRVGELMKRLEGGGEKEVILALDPSMEGEATALYLKRLITDRGSEYNVKMTRLGQGLPMGADIEYVDGKTLTHALEGRRDY